MVSAGAARAFGIPAGTDVAVGWSDALAGMLAAGAFAEETGFVLTGTSSIVGISTHDASAVADQLLTIPTACAPLRVLYGPTQSSGASIDWLGQLLGRQRRRGAGARGDRWACAIPSCPALSRTSPESVHRSGAPDVGGALLGLVVAARPR